MTSSLVGDTFFGLDLKKIKAHLFSFRRSVSKRILIIDFDCNALTLAEAQVQESAVNFAHVRRLSLPDEALERGAPTEPRKMAGLIRAFCDENNIHAHRAAVVIPHDAVFTALLSLPNSIRPDEALGYVLDPSSAAQVPVQLDQMDADLVPLAIAGRLPATQSYFLIATPKKLVDRVVETLHSAGMDLLQLNVGISAQLQHCSRYLQRLAPNHAVLHLDLQQDCTLAALLINSGPLKMLRMTSIRDFPDPLVAKGTASDTSHLNVEAQIIAGAGYLALSDLDLRRLSLEIKQFIRDCVNEYPDLQIVSVLLSGVNSAHPLIDHLLQDLLQLSVQIIRPLATSGVGELIPDAPLILQGLGRLIGAGLSFLPLTIRESSDSVSDESRDFQRRVDRRPNKPLLSAPQFVEQDQESSLTGLIPLTLNESALDENLLELNSDQEREQASSVFSDITTEFYETADHSEQDQSLLLSEEKIGHESMRDISPLSMAFSLSSEEESINPIAAPLEQPEPGEPNAVIHLEEDQDEVPFSMQDLLSSFEMKATDADHGQSMEVDAACDDELADINSVHLSDDSSMWPSISKLSENAQDDPQDVNGRG